MINSTKTKEQLIAELQAESTKQKQMVEALRESEKRYRTVFENTGTAMAIIEEDTTISLMNTEFEKLSGYSKEEIEGKRSWTEFVSKQDLERMKQYHDQRRKNPGTAPNSYEFQLIDKAGNVKDALLTIDIIPGTRRSICSILDITEHTQAEKILQEAHQELEKSEQRYRCLLENMNDGYLLLQNQRVAFANQRLADMVGYAVEDGIGKSMQGFLAPEIVKAAVKKHKRRLRGEPVQQQYETMLLKRDGTKLPIELSARLITYEGNPAISMIIRDITERKKMEKRMQKLYLAEKNHRQELEEEKRVRGRSIDALAHELRTPLTPLLASAMLLRDILPTGEERPEHELTDLIISGAETLAARLDELLDLARYTVGAFTITAMPIDILVTIKRIARQNRELAEEKKQSIVLDLPQETILVNGDRFRLEQVLTNLISNATKFSAEGSDITIRTRAKGSKVTVEVEDQGEGLSEEEQEKIFLPYHRVEQDRQRFSGLGLGLAICKQIVEAHRGKIWVQSRPGRGSKFSFTLPALDKLPPE